MIIATFTWEIGARPPKLRSHSAAKLRLIEYYLDAYFDAVVRNPTIEKLRITLVDGFCGGGEFDHNGTLVQGTPFLLLNAVSKAAHRLNQGKAKPLTLDAQFHFVDKEKKATDYLRDQLWQKGFGARVGNDIFIHTKTFENAASDIQELIKRRTSRNVGRSLFLLDQKGYSSAPVDTIRSIFNNFRKAECILTFAVDHLIDYLSDRPQNILAVAPVGIAADQVRDFIRMRGTDGGRYAIQRILLNHLQLCTEAEFATPFFIRSKEASKDLWLVHLSRHATARNVMVDSHWLVKNKSIHQGLGGLEINGFDPDVQDLPTFMFEDHERAMMIERLGEDILRRLRTDFSSKVQYGVFLDAIVNETPARLSDIDETVRGLREINELSLLDIDGKMRRSNTPVREDVIEIARQPNLFPVKSFRRKPSDLQA